MSLKRKSTFAYILGTGLGIFWLMDGLLQLQPKMFGMDFVNNVLVPNLSGQPAFLHSLIASGIRFFSSDTVLANSIVAVLQITIGVLLLAPNRSKKFRAGLYLSIIWGLVVWIFGEGLGEIFTGSASLYSGLPGAALIYVLISMLLLMPDKLNKNILATTAAIILLAGAILQMQPMFWGMQMTFLMSAADPVRVINFVPTIFSGLLSAHLIFGNWIQIIFPLLLALVLFFKPSKATLWLTIIFLFFVWWLGQDFGGLTTVWLGTATDVNTAPLIMLILLPLLFVDSAGSDNLA
jgi:hypothetical protein